VHVQVPVDVATFLLNEKRPEVQAIELRHKVTILLIPNIHMETPAHTITRLRHDDLNNDDLREPSYKMVDAPLEEAVKQGNGKDESAKPRQEAVIKGISPEQPAPIMPEKAEAAPVAAPQASSSGLFSRLFSWLRSEPKAEEPTPAPAPAPKKNREGRDGRRERSEGRNGRNGRNGNRREEGGERQERGNRNERNAEKSPREDIANSATEQRPEKERQERRPRGERKERRDRQPQQGSEVVDSKLLQEIAPIAPSASEAPETTTNTDEQTARRRGRRGGRGRGERRNEGETNATSSVEANNETSEFEASTPVASQEPVVVVIPAIEPSAVEVMPQPETPVYVVAEASPVAVENQPVADEQASSQTEQNVPVAPETSFATANIEAAPVATVASELPAEAPVQTQVIEDAPVDLQQVLNESGLVMVQTTSAPVIAATPTTPPKQGRPRKARQVEPADQAPLVMVETKN